MNKSYRTVWNASTGTWAAAAETARARSKGSLNTRRKTLAVVAAGMASFALPQAGAVFAAEADGTTVISEDAETAKPSDGDHDVATAPEASAAGHAAVADVAATDTASAAIETGGRTPERQMATAGTSVSGVDTIQRDGMIGIMTSGDTVLNVNTSGSGLPAPVATNVYDVALGQGAVATGPDAGFIPATALGTRANAIGAGTAAIGYRSTASADYAVAMGYQASAVTNSSIAIGNGAAATAGGAAGAGSSIAIGNGANVTGAGSMALGRTATVLNGAQSAVALGDNARASGGSSLAFGWEAASTNNRSAAIGPQSTASGPFATALGNQAIASTDGALAVGSVASATGDSSTAIGRRSVASQANATAVGVDARASAISSAALGQGASALSDRSSAIGAGTTASGRGSVALGSGAAARSGSDGGNIAIGSNASAENAAGGYGVIAIGAGASAGSGGYSGGMALGLGAASNRANIAVGNNANAAGAAGINGLLALGNNASATASSSIALGNASVADRQNSLSIGRAGAERQITNVAAGTQNTDAVTVSQLSGVVDALGGGAKLNPNGSIEAPTYNVDGKDVRNIGDALSNLDGRVTGNAGAIADLADQMKNSGLVDPTTGAAIAAVTYDNATKGSVTLGGAGATTPVTVKNVAKGVDGSDAVNVSQLTDATQSIRDDLASGALDMRYIKVNATGVQANAAGTNAVAIGSGANANGAGALALGTGARAQGVNAVALGFNSVATQANTVSVGRAGSERKIVNVAQGDVSADSTDAINGSQLYDALNSLTTTFDEKTKNLASNVANSMGTMSTNAGIMDVTAPLVAVEGLQGNNTASLNGSDAATTTAVAVGSSSVAAGGNTVAVGLQNVAGSNNAVAIGSFAQTGADSDYATAIGSNVQATGAEAVAMGANVEAGADNALVIGSNNARAIGAGSVALGSNARVNGGAANSIAVGTNAAVATNVTNALALGAGATVAAGSNGGVALGQGSVANRGNAVSVGGGTVGQRQIINVAAGTGTTDAVNVGQLASVTSALGGGATVAANGTVTQPTYKVDGKDYGNVGDALAALDGKSGSGTDPNAVAYDDATKSSVTLGGTGATAPVALKNVADGVDDHDAVNVSQLKTAGLVGDDGSGNLTSLAVAYDDATKSSVTLGGTGATAPVALKNVADGVDDHDAVNVSQLKTAGLVGDDGSGNLTSLAVGYDDATKSKVTLAGGATDTTITNVAAGAVDATSKDAINGSQLYGTAQSVADALGGGATVGADGKIEAPTYTVGGTDKHNVGDALSNLDGRTTTNTDDISDLKDKLADSGLVDPATGKAIAAVTYDDATKSSVTLGGTGATAPVALKNVADGVDDHDAVNVSQLKTAGLVGDDGSGNLTSLAVAYDDATKSSVTLGGTGATTPVALKNVADGVDDHDAVNVSQLKTAGLVGDDGSGNLTSLAVAYDDATKSSVTLGGTGATAPVALKNVADGVDDHDAVNVSQLKTAGLVGDDGSGNLTSLAVGYDDATKSKVTLAGGATGTTITNVAAGAVDATSKDAINGSQLYGTAQSVADALGGGATVGADGKIEAPTYTVGGTDMHNVGDALSNLDGRTTTNTDDISDLKDKLADSGLVDPATGKAIAAVTYDDATKSSVTLGGTGATTPVALKNVADGVDDHDAVNVSQLKTAGLVGDDGSGNLTSLAVAYDDATKSSVTLGGTGATAPVALKNVADGVDDHDAVNVSQLKTAGLVGDDGSGNLTSLAVAYDDATKSSVTLGGTGATAPVALKNVADGVDDHDAVNVSQLKTAGLVGDDGSGNLTSLAVGYDDATKSKVTLAGGATDTTITNVAAGAVDATSKDAINGSQLYGTAQSVADALGGGATVGADGKIEAPTYTIGGTDKHNVGDALSNLDGRTTTNTDDISDLKDKLADSGLVDPATGKAIAAVTYDDATKGSVTLGGDASTGTVIHNVGAGELSATSKDAVNGSQLFATNQQVGDLKDKLSAGGVFDPTTGESLAVTYENASKNSVKLGNDGTPVRVSNVAAGTAGTDAVNVDQLTSGLSDLRQDLTNGAIDLRFIKVNADPATGVAAIANGAQAVAIGSGAGATGAHALALGTGARASGLDSVALGYNSVATQAYTVSVGRVGNERRIVNVADGNIAFESKDAINGGQLYAAMNGLSTSVNSTTQQAIDQLSSSLDAKTQAAIDQINSRSSQLMDVTAPLVAVEGVQSPNTASLNGGDASTTTAVAIGSGAVASGSNTVANGLNAMAMSDNATAIGSFAQVGAASEYGVAMGSNAQATGKEAVALGANVEAGADNALAIGSGNAQAVGAGSIALGNHAVVNAGAANSIAVGSNASIARNVSDALALGSGANVAAGANGGIALGAGSIANRGNALSIGSAGAERQIVNVAAGTAQTDAVNVGQLAGLTKALGGSAAVGADGSITQPTYTIDGKTYSNVSDALAAAAASGGSGTPAQGTVAYDDAAKSAVTLGGVGSTTPVALKNVADGVDDHDAVNVSQLKSTGLVADDGSGNLTSLAVAYDDVNKDAVTLGGTGATSAVALKNVAAGAVSATSSDAINGSQLFGTAQSVAASLGGGATVGADGTITQPTFNVGGTDVHTVGDALTNLDGRVTGNTGDIADLRKQLSNTGLVDAGTGQTLAAVTYDVDPATGATNRNSVTLGGASATAPVALKNVADGVDDHDAVNVSQLKSTGLVADDGNGNLTSLAVGYDDATKDAITLGGAHGTTITNVAAGAVSATSTDAINGSQLYGTAQSVADTLGGGVTVNADGTVSKASFLVNGDRYATVEDALTAASKSGATDSLAVKYDNVDHTRVSLGGTGALAPVVLTNVANGSAQYDAVNYGQLSSLQSELNEKLGSMDGRVGKLEAGVLPGDGSGGGSGGGEFIGGTGGSGDTSGPVVAPNPGNGNGNVAVGSGSSVADGANDGTAIGSGSNVGGTGGTAIGSGSKAADAGSTAVGQGASVAAGAGNSVAIGQGSVATESNTVSFGSSGNERRLVNIADGVNASDAATKGQLDRAMGGMQNQVNDLSRNAYSGIAAATALTMIPGVDPGKTLSFGIGGATYRGYQAVAFGGEARITQNLKMKAGVGLSSGGNTVGVGASYQW